MNMAKESGLKLQGENAAKQVYDKAMELGFGKEDFCATIKLSLIHI